MKMNVIRLLIYLKYMNKDNTSIFGWMLNMDTGNPILYKKYKELVEEDGSKRISRWAV